MIWFKGHEIVKQLGFGGLTTSSSHQRTTTMICGGESNLDFNIYFLIHECMPTKKINKTPCNKNKITKGFLINSLYLVANAMATIGRGCVQQQLRLGAGMVTGDEKSESEHKRDGLLVMAYFACA